MARSLLLSLLICIAAASGSARAQNAGALDPATIAVVGDDVPRFWAAYDAVRAEPDVVRQRALFESLYVAPGTDGLHAFMEAKGYTSKQVRLLCEWYLRVRKSN